MVCRAVLFHKSTVLLQNKYLKLFFPVKYSEHMLMVFFLPQIEQVYISVYIFKAHSDVNLFLQ